jgi:4-diphosphocytidyl-2-C-methyl-D-erythritol kinase
MLSRMFQLGLSDAHLAELALQLGSDCAFFIANKPVFAQGRGELFEPIAISLSGKHVVIARPGFSINTAEAYSLVTPGKRRGLQQAVSTPITTWKENVRNDFEQAVFFEISPTKGHEG